MMNVVATEFWSGARSPGRISGIAALFAAVSR
jgi:hypothetical protein